MRIVVNGQPMDVREGLTIADLLGELRIRQEFTAVALNREVASRSSYAARLLRAGDRVEIVHPMAGGARGRWRQESCGTSRWCWVAARSGRG